MIARSRAGALVCFLVAGCTAVVGLPSAEPEESAPACSNGVDDDLDGEADCADPSCRAVCWEGMGLLPADLAPCFADEAWGLAFRPVRVDGLHQRCEPDPDSAPECVGREHRLPGASGCRVPGSACAQDADWPAAPGGDAPVVYVRAGAEGGDGSRDAPWGTIARALAEAPEGARVLLSEGEHLVAGSPARSIELRGVCAERTIVRGTLRLEAASLVSLHDLAWAPPAADPSSSALEIAGGTVRLAGVVIEGAVRVEGAGAELEAEDASLSAAIGAAVTVREGARASLRACTIASAPAGVDVEGSSVQLSGVAIRGTVDFGVRAGGAATLESAGLVVEPAGGVGIELACDAGTERCADLAGSIVRFPTAAPDRRGIVARSGRVRLAGADVVFAASEALLVDGAVVDLSDAILEQSVPGSGIRVGAGGFLRLTRAFLRDHRERGLVVEPGGETIANDVEIRGPLASTAEICVEARTGSALHASQIVLESCRICGLRLERDVELTLESGLVAGNERGVCLVEGAEYALGVLTSGVTYRDNGDNLYRE